DEWGGWYEVEPETNPGFLYQQNTMRDAMIAGMTLNIFNNHAKRVKMANLAQTINVLQAVILTKGKDMIVTPTYHVMEMYKVHQDAKLIPIEMQSDTYKYGEEEIPAISASASKDKQGSVHISVVNIDPKAKKKVSLDLGGIKVKHLTGRILTASNLREHNTFEQPNTVLPQEYKDAKLKGNQLEIDIPAHSVIVLELI